MLHDKPMTAPGPLESDNGSIDLQPKITVEDKSVHYKNNEQTLLECLEAADIEVHFHCRDGFCGACRVKLIEGKVNYPQGEPLAFVAEDEILPCCCIPITDISLKID